MEQAVTKRHSSENPAAVTPEMIKAGLEALEQWKDLPPGELIAAVYRAMAACAPFEAKNTAQPSPTVLDVLKRLGH
jgi:hypothetical protein